MVTLMNQVLKNVTLILIAVGVAGTVYLSGASSAVITCAPFLLFIGAAFLGRRPVSRVCNVLALIIAVVFGAHSYYEAFHIHQHGEVDGIAILVVLVVQAVIAALALLIAFGEWLHYRSKQYDNPIA